MTDPTPAEEERLRAALRAAVPQAPAIAAPPARRRSRAPYVAALAAAAVAAVVTAVVVVPALVTGDDDRAAGGPERVERSPLPEDPRAAAPCPGRLPRAGGSAPTVPDLRGAVTVRLCGWEADAGFTPGTPSSELLVPDDALVAGLDELAREVGALSPARPDRCAAASYYDPYRTSVVVTTADGSTTLPASPCESVRLPGGAEVGAGEVADLVIEALGRQRATGEYPPFRFATSSSEMRAWCDAPATLAPVVPGDSDLAAAVVCPDVDDRRATPTPLDEVALERLRGAWGATADPAPDPASDGYDDELAHVVALTSYGDLVRMVPEEGVDGLVLVVPRQGFLASPVAVVPTSIDDLTGDLTGG